MNSESQTEFSAKVAPQGRFFAIRAGRSAVLRTVTKLVLLAGTMAVFTPMWLDLLGQLGSMQSWNAQRLIALGGIAGLGMLLALGFKLTTVLFQSKARAAV